jgi:hypothetical protein
MIAYFGEVFKICANIAYIMMTLNRYLLVGKDHAPWLVKIAKLEFKWVIRVSFMFSVLINIGHGWQYKVVEDIFELSFHDIEVDTPIYSIYTTVNGVSYSDYPQANQGSVYFYFTMVYFCINFVVFFILNTGIEIKLVRRMKKELQEKRKRAAKMNTSKSHDSPLIAQTKEVITLEVKKQKKQEDDKKEKRVIRMVILNGIFNFFLRSTEILFWMENANYWSILFPITPGTLSHYAPGLLNLIADIGYLTYILTFTTNFLIFYKFNSKFQEAVVFFNLKPNIN